MVVHVSMIQKRRSGVITNETTFTRDQMREKLTSIYHRMAFDNEQNP